MVCQMTAEIALMSNPSEQITTAGNSTSEIGKPVVQFQRNLKLLRFVVQI